MYYVSAQGVDERMINVHNYYYYYYYYYYMAVRKRSEKQLKASNAAPLLVVFK